MIKDFKVYVKYPEVSEIIQELVFENGYKWNVGGMRIMLSDKKYLFFSPKGKEIMYGSHECFKNGTDDIKEFSILEAIDFFKKEKEDPGKEELIKIVKEHKKGLDQCFDDMDQCFDELLESLNE